MHLQAHCIKYATLGCLFFPADIDKVLSNEIFLNNAMKLPLIIERFDLMEVWCPYLFVRGLEDWINKDSIAEHFEAEANGAKVEYVELDKEGTEARVMFIDPQGNDAK